MIHPVGASAMPAGPGSARARKALASLTAILLLGAAAVSVAGCGADPATRGVSGGLIGAGAGAGIAAMTGGKPATGALIGGAAGAAGGVLTAH